MPFKNHHPNIGNFFWQMMPFLVIVLLIFLTLIPGQLPFKAVNPPFPLIAIFYWAVFRPDTLSVGVIFVAGVLVDLLTGVTIGAHAFLYVLVFSLSKTNRRFLSGQGFIMLWFSFFMICLVHQAALWTGYTIFHRQVIMSPYPLLLGGVVVAALLPILFPMLLGVEKQLDRAEEEAL